MSLQDQTELLNYMIRHSPDATIRQFVAAVKERQWMEQSNEKLEQLRILNGQGAIKMMV